MLTSLRIDTLNNDCNDDATVNRSVNGRDDVSDVEGVSKDLRKFPAPEMRTVGQMFRWLAGLLDQEPHGTVLTYRCRIKDKGYVVTLALDGDGAGVPVTPGLPRTPAEAENP